MPTSAERVLFVHAHPDDETISTGGTIATLVDRGAAVTVLTCTRGEQGEVIPPELAHLEGDAARLAAHREVELAEAMRILGVTDHRYLGNSDARWPGNEPRRYLDSGMRWGAAGAEALETTADGSFTAAVFGEAAADVAAVIADTQPQLVVSYDENGGYGHPDHIQAHRVARRAAEVMGVPFWVIGGQGADAAAGESVTVDVAAVLDRTRSALEAHATQLVVTGDSFALSNGDSSPIALTETFRLLRPPKEPGYAFRDQSLRSKILNTVTAIAFGATAGLVMTTAHQATVEIAGLVIPWGIIVALVSTAALVLGLRLAFDTKVLPLIAAAALMALVVVLTGPTFGGSLIVPANPAGYIWTFGPTVITATVLVWPRSHRRRAGNIEVLPAPKGSRIP